MNFDLSDLNAECIKSGALKNEIYARTRLIDTNLL
jgi:hypothetical protein